MKSKLITVILLLMLIGMFIVLGNFIFSKTNPQRLISPDEKAISQKITGQKITPSPTPTPTPIEFHFDKSTNLQKELDAINPQVQDSDFDNLKQITTPL